MIWQRDPGTIRRSKACHCPYGVTAEPLFAQRVQTGRAVALGELGATVIQQQAVVMIAGCRQVKQDLQQAVQVLSLIHI